MAFICQVLTVVSLARSARKWHTRLPTTERRRRTDYTLAKCWRCTRHHTKWLL